MLSIQNKNSSYFVEEMSRKIGTQQVFGTKNMICAADPHHLAATALVSVRMSIKEVDD